MSIRKPCREKTNFSASENDYAVSFKEETMPNGKSYSKKQVFGIKAILDEMRLRNGRPWKNNDEAEMRDWIISTYPER